MRRGLQIVAVATLTACCWLALAAWPGGQLFVCGASGVAEIIPAWSADRAVSLLAMWAVMSAAMLLPCAVIEAGRGRVAVEATLAKATALAMVAGSAQWLLESVGAVERGLLLGGESTQMLLVLIAAIALAVHLASRPRWAGSIAMLALQFASGPMNFGWMAVISAGMVLLAIAAPILARDNDALIKSSMLIQTE